MLCSICQSIDFYAANCPPYPESGGAKHQPTSQALALSAKNGCELCGLIWSKVPDNKRPSGVFTQGGTILCNLWNWYDGPVEEYRGSATIIFRDERSQWSVILSISAEEDSELAVANLISGRIAQPSANSQACFDLSEKWVNSCLSTHNSSCPHDATASLPTRVLDVGTNGSSKQVRLLETKGLEGVWVALSHCWGRTARYVTETKTLQQRIEAIALSELPKTFLDAVIITQRLGYQYLWIDSLCILQDSNQDWLVESRQMQNYYSKSVLTIASDLASGDHESFLDNGRSPVVPLKIPFTAKNGTSASHVYISNQVKTQGPDSPQTPLGVRGWTLQEDVLSPRTLHYTSAELAFECQRSRFAETDVTPQGYTDSDAMGSIKRFFLKPESGFQDPLVLKYPTFTKYYQPIQRWYRLFEVYCTRLLTFESDRLAAIAGLAKEIQRQTTFSYKAGIWLENIHHGLLWAVNGRGETPDRYRAPSWSWAALDMNFYWGNSTNPDFQLYMHSLWISDTNAGGVAEILGCDVQTVNGDPFGDVMAGQLRLRGLVMPLNEWRGTTSPCINTFWHPVAYHQCPVYREGTSAPGGFRRPMAADQLVLDFDVTPEEVEDSDTNEDDDSGVVSDEESNEDEVEVALRGLA
ncbi:hypothetical protein LHYA1_G007618 [Lachnellula hyalina]|uniref:Heterokaryon incompatibility domain-containing protein n=1 Tax=Lachnellula hyalina TaxID=1316788 RepID=A0A8H8TXX4_9HELO|nr:uncharacterized protein LHYA1_G007618 [Lachnellula hyalina]TVY23381.1 hypothetical protein LHYA1_G007618 [Lachnellula hyalina]